MSKVFKAVGNAVSSVVKAVVNVVSSVVKAVVNVVASVINFVAQPFMGMFGGVPDVPGAAAEAARQQGVLLQREGSDVSVPVVYGYRKVGGHVAFAETGADNNKYLYVVYVFSEGTVEGLREVGHEKDRCQELPILARDPPTKFGCSRMKMTHHEGLVQLGPNYSLQGNCGSSSCVLRGCSVAFLYLFLLQECG
jgi:hypothetical protein